jgi:DNA-binding GntR family transcriptional regulator
VITVKEHVYRIIRGRLESGALSPGVRVSDDALAREIGVSRSPVREAIGQLATEGLVEYRPRRGCFVRIPSRQEMKDLYEARIALESFAAGKAAGQASKGDRLLQGELLKNMRDIVYECREMPSQTADKALTDRFLAVDLEFHMHILKMAGNERILAMVRDCKILTRIFGHVPVVHDLHLLAWDYRESCAIARAIARGEEERASQWMAKHIRRAMEMVLAQYDAKSRTSGRSAGRTRAGGRAAFEAEALPMAADALTGEGNTPITTDLH